MENVCVPRFKEEKWAPGAAYACSCTFQCQLGDTKECCQLKKNREMPPDQIKQLKKKYIVRLKT